MVELLAVVLEQRQAEPVEGAQRRPQVVRRGVAEGLELLVRSLQLEGALQDAPLQVHDHLGQFALGLPPRVFGLPARRDVGDHGYEVHGTALLVAEQGHAGRRP